MTLPKSETQDLGTYIRSITIPILVQLDLFSLIHSFFSVSLMEHEPKKRWTEMWRAQYISTPPLTFQETSLLETRIHLSVDGRSDDLRGFGLFGENSEKGRTHYEYYIVLSFCTVVCGSHILSNEHVY